MTAVKNISFRFNKLNENSKYRAYVLSELSESKKKALNPETVLEDHDDFLCKWTANRMARKNVL
jgi:hypothetical protein